MIKRFQRQHRLIARRARPQLEDILVGLVVTKFETSRSAGLTVSGEPAIAAEAAMNNVG
jgi:hypothetical protein